MSRKLTIKRKQEKQRREPDQCHVLEHDLPRRHSHQTPDLHFILDESVARGAAISALIDQANAATAESDDDTAPGEPETLR